MIYDFLLILYAFGMAPKILWQAWRRGKKMPRLRERFGFNPPNSLKEGRRIWIHAVSLGEIKAALPLIQQLRQMASLNLLITTTTATGYEEACQSMPNGTMIRYLPLDFSWIMRRWIASFRPDQLIFVEGDIWPNLLHEAHRQRVFTALVSGKISEKSARRFRFFRKIANRIFGTLDQLLVQNEEHRNRFDTFIDHPIYVVGNLKLDIQPIAVNPDEIRHRFSLPKQNVLTISCTHAPEEKDLLTLLYPLWDEMPDLILFLAPRHPERFDEVAALLHQMKIPFCRWNETRTQERLILVDSMGQLAFCYSVSSLAVMAGSFSSHKGGHNVIEPCLYGCPVLFGPSMHAQKEFAKIVCQAGAGQEISEEMLAATVLKWLQSPAQFRANALRLVEQNRGCASRTAQLLEQNHKLI